MHEKGRFMKCTLYSALLHISNTFQIFFIRLDQAAIIQRMPQITVSTSNMVLLQLCFRVGWVTAFCPWKTSRDAGWDQKFPLQRFPDIGLLRNWYKRVRALHLFRLLKFPSWTQYSPMSTNSAPFLVLSAPYRKKVERWGKKYFKVFGTHSHKDFPFLWRHESCTSL